MQTTQPSTKPTKIVSEYDQEIPQSQTAVKSSLQRALLTQLHVTALKATDQLLIVAQGQSQQE